MPRRPLPTLPDGPRPTLPDAVLSSTGFLAGQVAARIKSRFEAVLAEHRLLPRHFLLMLILRDEGVMTQRALGERAGFDRTTTMQAAQALEDAGLLTRSDDPDDRRLYRLALTAGGRRLVTTLDARIRKTELEVLAPLSAEQRTTLHALLRRVVLAEDTGCDR